MGVKDLQTGQDGALLALVTGLSSANEQWLEGSWVTSLGHTVCQNITVPWPMERKAGALGLEQPPGPLAFWPSDAVTNAPYEKGCPPGALQGFSRIVPVTCLAWASTHAYQVLDGRCQHQYDDDY